jgi:hypothetical protein
MNPNFAELVSHYRDRGALIATNLFLVLLVGNVDPRLIGTTARTDGYSASDYERLRDVLIHFNRFLILPQILTEAGNLLKRNCPTAKTLLDFSLELARFVHAEQTREARVTSKRVTLHPTFPQLGYADAAILTAAAGKYLLVTADRPLQGMAWSTGVDVLPFQWLQQL